MSDVWIFLRGLTREGRHWGSFVREFCERVPDARVLPLDLPGNGEHWREPSFLRIEEMTEWCRAELQRKGVSPPYRVLALSLGAMVAADWSARHPEEILRQVLVATSVRSLSPFYRRLRPWGYPALLLALVGPAAMRERIVFRLTSRQRPPPAGLLAHWLAWCRQRPVTRLNALRQLLAALRYAPPPGTPLVPTLVLAAAGDRLVHPECSRRLARAWQVECRVHPGAGHDLPLDDGPWVSRQVAEWLLAQAQARRGAGVDMRCDSTPR